MTPNEAINMWNRSYKQIATKLVESIPNHVAAVCWKGWIKEFLICEGEGMPGHLHEIGYPFDKQFISTFTDKSIMKRQTKVCRFYTHYT